MFDDHLGPGLSSLSRNSRLSLSDIERTRELRILLKNVKRRLAEKEQDIISKKDETSFEKTIMLAIQREIFKREQMAICSEFGIQ